VVQLQTVEFPTQKVANRIQHPRHFRQVPDLSWRERRLFGLRIGLAGLMYQSPDQPGNKGVESDNSEYDARAARQPRVVQQHRRQRRQRHGRADSRGIQSGLRAGPEGKRRGEELRAADPLIARRFEYSDPDFAGLFGSPLYRAGWSAPPDDGFFDQSAQFIGGIGEEDFPGGDGHSIARRSGALTAAPRR
jgi:hypothetical protein